MPVTVIDIRPLQSTVAALTFMQADATDLQGLQYNSIESLSSLHAVEHFGLGRYGDPVDPGASFRAMNALARVLRPGGRLYFSVPIGRERVEFYAHRTIAPKTVLNTLYDLESTGFSGVDDNGNYQARCNPSDFRLSRFACGFFELTKE